MTSLLFRTTLLSFILASLFIIPASGQDENITNDNFNERREIRAIEYLLSEFEASFNSRDINRRMNLCLDTYHEYAFEFGKYKGVKNFNETKRESGGYWSSIRSMQYSIDEYEIALDGPIATVKATTTHLAQTDRHRSIVHFSLVKIDNRWWIASDSYNIIRRYN